ncbi:MAG: acyl-CoA dehydrogenase [Pseudomonadota bacterium]|nr:acyl-CoA dehydrogenase [Pseudomonadota bacterium]
MSGYKTPIRDTLFILNEVLNVDSYLGKGRFSNLSKEDITIILEQGSRFVESEIYPLNKIGDHHGCVLHKDHSVSTPPGFREVYHEFCKGGWNNLGAPLEFGGQGLPTIISTAFEEYSISANMAFSMYPGLTQDAVLTISSVGTLAQKETYIPKMVEGVWSGTMNLTEPQCGTDLGLIRSKAEPQDDGTYKISGTKIFISSGEHDLTENIIHLVLARIPGESKNTKGLSMFIVPKFIVDEGGNLGKRNNLKCTKVEKKMGIHGNATCEIFYEEAEGYLIGEKNKGLNSMFVMMNVARLQTGMQGLAISEVARQKALNYSNLRRQGRERGGELGPIPIINHPDIKRIIAGMNCFTEGARALALWTAFLMDIEDENFEGISKIEAKRLVEFLTPIVKAYFTDNAFTKASEALQCFGGYGYITDYEIEQFVRDVRVAMIYEGTNSIQAMDLVFRKVLADGGQSINLITRLIDNLKKEIFFKENNEYIIAVEKALIDLKEAVEWLKKNHCDNNVKLIEASAVYFLRLCGHIMFGYIWLRMIIGTTKLDVSDEANRIFMNKKIATGKFFFNQILSESEFLLKNIKKIDVTLLKDVVSDGIT